MATLTILTREGEERSWMLEPGSLVRIGRDADNEVVLRDPRVSRHHARILHEKGFFVIYDLASSNGTFVQGKRVQVAPLVNGTEIRIGGSVGRFRDDSPGKKGTLVDQRTEDFSEGNTDEEGKPSATRPIPRPDPGDTEKSAVDENATRGTDATYSVDFASGGASVVRNGEKPLFFFHRPPRLVAWVGSLTAAMVAATGVTAVVVLLLLDRFLSAGLAGILTMVFIVLILTLIPIRELILFRDESMSEVGLVIRQSRRLPVPVTEYRAEEPGGIFLAFFSKNFSSTFGRRRWWILDENASPLGWAEEDSLRRVMARKVAGHAIRALRSNYRFVIGGRFVGQIDRREDRNVIDLTPDEENHFDRRLAIPLSVLILSIEGR
ncbi:MAG: FHA domain-containing protein [Thermoanaerobaculia bacterium]